MTELGNLIDDINSIAVQLATVKAEINNALSRIDKSEKNLLEIQFGITKEANRLFKEITDLKSILRIEK